MTWTYTADPENVPRDAVRLLIGDTDTADQQLQDSEIDFYIATYGSALMAAGKAARALAAKYTRKADKEVGDLKIAYSQIAKNYFLLAEQLEAQAGRTGSQVQIYVGGVSRSEKARVEANTDRSAPSFRRGQFDNPSAVSRQFNPADEEETP